MSVYSRLTSTVIQLLLRLTRPRTRVVGSECDKLTILLASMASASDHAVTPLLVLVSLTAEWSPLLADMGSGGGISLDTSLERLLMRLQQKHERARHL